MHQWLEKRIVQRYGEQVIKKHSHTAAFTIQISRSTVKRYALWPNKSNKNRFFLHANRNYWFFLSITLLILLLFIRNRKKMVERREHILNWLINLLVDSFQHCCSKSVCSTIKRFRFVFVCAQVIFSLYTVCTYPLDIANSG